MVSVRYSRRRFYGWLLPNYFVQNKNTKYSTPFYSYVFVLLFFSSFRLLLCNRPLSVQPDEKMFDYLIY
jgi:hypothetical protein